MSSDQEKLLALLRTGCFLELSLGMTRQEVIAYVGIPMSHAANEEYLIFTYGSLQLTFAKATDTLIAFQLECATNKPKKLPVAIGDYWLDLCQMNYHQFTALLDHNKLDYITEDLSNKEALFLHIISSSINVAFNPENETYNIYAIEKYIWK